LIWRHLKKEGLRKSFGLYAELKAYKKHPDLMLVAHLEASFTAIFTQCTEYATLGRLLMRLHQHK